ncbi:hypothetical protein Tsubulata_043807 [Turnera subulata]|uniref:Cellulose synthase-like protein H1 n=1 Tax=Turnera subulata TaxID=218843 RepID=A0A9Q0FI76_9ROSI|nr:hypothetical protein Tsubulata_043807 [Turnera subulata]
MASNNILYERVARKNTIHRVLDITILFLLLSVLAYRLASLNKHGVAWILAFFCESCFTFVWVITISTKWTQVEYKTYPERLSQRMEEFPAVDMFVTTADPMLEPPLLTANTVISLMAVDYPADKLACYVSDDGCSALTFYTLVEASKFAKIWIPFCKKYNIEARAPFRYFSRDQSTMATGGDSSLEFERECRKMKEGYAELICKINDATHKSIPEDVARDFAVFSNIDRRNHPTIVKVIWENKERLPDGLPHLIYISREKRVKHPHHYKAGAMNVLTRVSGLLTNAPYMLNVDCDNFVNNPQTVRHAMCFFLGSDNDKETGFVQFPQSFYGGLKDDPFGNQYRAWYEYILRGLAGIQGPFYGGTGCFHRRKVIYGLCPDDTRNEAKCLSSVTGNLAEKEQLKIFGCSKEFNKSATEAFQGKTSDPVNLSKMIEEAVQVAGCGYEYGTRWGTEVGWQYGSTTEDIMTGITIQGRGWKTILCTPHPEGFLGCSPSGGPNSMTQQKRWATGLLEVLFSKRSPIIATITARLQFRQCLGYLWILIWGLRSIPELGYALLPAYCIITNSTFLPQVKEPAILIYVALFTLYNTYTLLEYLQLGLSIREWWNNLRMMRIYAMNPWLFGFVSVIFKILGISETVFEVTQKDQSDDGDDSSDGGRFTFNGSHIFLPGTTLVLLQLTALTMRLLGLIPSVSDDDDGRHGSGLCEVLCSLWVVMCFWPFVKGLVGRGKYGIPLSTICKSTLLSFLFVQLCKMTSPA